MVISGSSDYFSIKFFRWNSLRQPLVFYILLDLKFLVLKSQDHREFLEHESFAIFFSEFHVNIPAVLYNRVSIMIAS